ncbi:Major facilitator super domain-containing protein 12 [Chamberlinius hualienensis]
MEDGIAADIRQPLPWRQKLSYSIGHVLNDLCASMWFTYLLVYLHRVLRFSNLNAGIVLLVGQIADALATPFVGLELDKLDNFILCRNSRKKSWHLVGTICVILSFPFIFIHCLGCQHSSQMAQVIYYSGFVIIFQFGWAAVQISHLSLIPDLTEDDSERTELTALRYAFTVISNIAVYGITWLILGITGSEHQDNQIGPEDLFKFRDIVLIVVAVGFVKSFLFHAGVKEKKVSSWTNPEDSQLSINSKRPSRKLMNWSDWLKEKPFYQVAVVYMFTRLFVNLIQAYMPLYLQDTMVLPETSIAIFPLIMYVSGFLSSFFMKTLNRRFGRKLTFSIGVVFGLGASIWVYFGEGSTYTSIELYIVAALYGVASSTVLITSLSITADLIGSNVESGAFVYGAMSFTDKLSNGLAIMLIQNFSPCQYSNCLDHSNFFRFVLTFVCGGSCVMALLALVTIKSGNIGSRRLERQQILGKTANEDDPLIG